MPTTYEFVLETVDEHDDIIDTSGFDTMKEAHEYALMCDEPWRICLRRDTGNNVEGITDRFYAYPDANGRLPQRMETCDDAGDGPNVPKKYRAMTFPVDTRPR